MSNVKGSEGKEEKRKIDESELREEGISKETVNNIEWEEIKWRKKGMIVKEEDVMR